MCIRDRDDPRRDLRFLTVRNRVYIVNTAVTVAQSSTFSADRGNELLITANTDPPYNSITRMSHVHEGTEDSTGVQEGWSKIWYLRPESGEMDAEISANGEVDASGGAARMFEAMLFRTGENNRPQSGFVSSERSPNAEVGQGEDVNGFDTGNPSGYDSWAHLYTYRQDGRTVYINKDPLTNRRATEADTFWGVTLWSSEPELATIVGGRGARSVDLPGIGYPGMVVHVNRESPGVGASESALDSYFVRFVTEPWTDEDPATGEIGPGAWEETVGPGVRRGLDDTTMPVVLERTRALFGETGTYSLVLDGWTPRTAGTEMTAPDPSFVGSRIGGLAYIGGRLAILSPGAVSLSSQDDNLSFYRSSVLADIATDPIDLAVDSAGEEPLHAALHVGGALLVFGRTRQYLLSTRDGAITAETATLKSVSEYDASPSVSPAVYGTCLLYTSPSPRDRTRSRMPSSA